MDCVREHWSSRVVGALLIVGAVIVTAGANGCGHSCGGVGCLNAVVAHLELPVPAAELLSPPPGAAPARLTFCRRDDCVDRLLVNDCLSNVDEAIIVCAPDHVAGRADVLVVDASVPEASTSIDGEVFTFIVSDAIGMVLAHKTGGAHFADVYTSGPRCGATCRQANLP